MRVRVRVVRVRARVGVAARDRARLRGGGEVVGVYDQELLARELTEPALQVLCVARALGEWVARHHHEL